MQRKATNKILYKLKINTYSRLAQDPFLQSTGSEPKSHAAYR